ncbi:MAG: hypothetical protein HKM28_06945, partial [Flavobacteriaceae bacterium]|nr:hypothetical protein [Flavobacteriaceae bacterium]
MKTTGFKMKASAAAFRILSDSLYKSPHLACVRELVCNAWDSQVKKGNTDVPIEVHAPTNLEPYFEVNDFGVSMDHEFMHSRFITFFDSDKDHSDEAIGGYGLGSKAPFAYADQFTVRCRLDGVQRTYQMLINASSEYEIMDRGVSDTSEPDGVKVTVPVADKDIESFRDATASVLAYFPVRPKCNVELPEVKYSNEVVISKDVVLRHLKIDPKDPRRSSYDTFSVIMGFVKYKCDWRELDAISKSIDVNTSVLKGTHLHVPINHLDITPDREGIRFSDKTKGALQKVLEYAWKKLDDSLRTEFFKQGSNIDKALWLDSFDNIAMSNRARKLFVPELEGKFTFPEPMTVICRYYPAYGENPKTSTQLLTEIPIIDIYKKR